MPEKKEKASQAEQEEQSHSSTVAWFSEPSSLTALRVRKTRQAYHNHDLFTALLEAEEILDKDPDNTEALELLGNTELELGHAREALLVFQKLRSLHPDSLDYLGGLAVARFLMADFRGSLRAVMHVLEKKPDLAEANANAGLALERLMMSEKAEHYLKRAAELDPDTFPLPVPEHEIDWSGLLARAMEHLPEPISQFYRRVPLVWHVFPDQAVLLSVDPPITPMALALYEGNPPGGDLSSDILPRSVRIYKGIARRMAFDMEALAEDLAQALLTEATDWLRVPLPPEEP